MTKTFIQTGVFEKQWDALALTDEDLCRLEYIFFQFIRKVKKRIYQKKNETILKK